MKEQTLPELPIVGHLKLKTRDDRSICEITVSNSPASKDLDPFFNECFLKLRDFLTGHSMKLDLPLDFSAVTPFQHRVLMAMKEIPYGEVRSYKDLAEALGSKGYQAVGTACGQNPFMLIYPCHRVVGSKGIGGFAHGTRMKQELLALEAGAVAGPLITGVAQKSQVLRGSFPAV